MARITQYYIKILCSNRATWLEPGLREQNKTVKY
jgi:hypothetical protein